MTGVVPASVSVIVPAYNASAYLSRAFSSVMTQTERAGEVILVDDGSIDDSCAQAGRRWGCTVHRLRHNSGPAAARNAGLQIARGAYVAFLDADDTWPRDALGAMKRLLADAGTDAVHGRVRDIWPDGNHGTSLPKTPRWSFNVGSAMFRCDILRQLGGFDASRRIGEDVDLWFRLRDGGYRVQRTRHVTLNYHRRPPTAYDTPARHHALLAELLRHSIRRTKSPI